MVAVLIGNYGVGNLGDEALREYFLESFPEVEWKVLSANPTEGEYARLPSGLRSFFAFKWVRTLKMMRTADAVVFGGGSLFTDVESSFACFLWGMHAWVASFLGKKVVLASQGMGPYRTKRGEWFARKTVAKAAFISVRDEESVRRISEWHKSTKVVQTFDPIFSLFLAKKISKNTKNVFIIISRNNVSETFRKEVSYAIQNNTWEEVMIVLMEGEHEEEKKTANEFLSISGTVGSIKTVTNVDDLMDSLADASLVYSQRFHGALAALAAGVRLKVFPQGAGDKMSIVVSLQEKGGDVSSTLNAQVKEGEDALHAWFGAGI